MREETMFILVCFCTNFDKFLRMELSGTLSLFFFVCYVEWDLYCRLARNHFKHHCKSCHLPPFLDWWPFQNIQKIHDSSRRDAIFIFIKTCRSSLYTFNVLNLFLNVRRTLKNRLCGSQAAVQQGRCRISVLHFLGTYLGFSLWSQEIRWPCL